MADLVIDNPYTFQEAARRPRAGEAEVDELLDRAAAAARAFSATEVSDRVALCQRAMVAMKTDGERIAGDITAMMGKPLRQGRNEVAAMTQRADHMMAIAAESLADTEVPGRPGFERRIERVPLGVVFNMPAWNYPLLTCVNAVVPAVLAGNAVVLKHSTRTALCGEHFAQAFQQAGAPDGLFQALHCDHDTAARVAQDRRTDYVAFTGSVSGGRAVYRAVAAGQFSDVGLELGGKDAAYVAADADVEKAAAGLVDGACYNAGQSCCGVERVYVHRSLHDDFVGAALTAMQALKLGDPTTEVDMGPMAQPGAPAFLERQVAEAKTAGAGVLCGGKAVALAGKGRFFEPTLMTRVSHQLDVMRSESFGPILPVMAVDDDDQALALMNDSDLGLTASVWTSDRDRAARLARALAVGTVYMNQCDLLDPALPWTGVKDSGKGSTLSPLGLHHLTRPRSIFFKL
jgi:acyl-CoA reductase-like NAD-dependent aldehyde dehydrogenase